MASWREARNGAQWHIGTLEALLHKVHQENVSLDIPSDLPIPPRPWQNTGPSRNPFMPRLLPNDFPVPLPVQTPLIPTTTVSHTSEQPRQSSPSEQQPQHPSPLVQPPRRSSPSDHLQRSISESPWRPPPLESPQRSPHSDSMAVDLAPLSPVSSTDLDWEGSDSDSDSAESPYYSMSEASDASDAD